MRSPVEVNEMLTQTPHFPLTIMLTFVIAALVALRRESDPTLRTDACPVLSCPAFLWRERCPHHSDCSAHLNQRQVPHWHFRAAPKGTLLSDGATTAMLRAKDHVWCDSTPVACPQKTHCADREIWGGSRDLEN